MPMCGVVGAFSFFLRGKSAESGLLIFYLRIRPGGRMSIAHSRPRAPSLATAEETRDRRAGPCLRGGTAAPLRHGDTAQRRAGRPGLGGRPGGGVRSRAACCGLPAQQPAQGRASRAGD